MIRLLAISDGRAAAAGTEPLLRWLRALGEAGVDAVQLREKDSTDRQLFGWARQARALLPRPTRLLINGRADVALAAGAAGVHLPFRGVPAQALRERFGDRLVLGVSTHHLDEVEAARDAGADYVVFGPVYPTPSKPDLDRLPGLEGLARVCRVGIPVLALGGVSRERLEDIAQAGAAGVAGIRCFQDLEELGDFVNHARNVFDRKGGSS